MTRSRWVPALIAGLLIVVAVPANAVDKDDDDDAKAEALMQKMQKQAQEFLGRQKQK